MMEIKTEKNSGVQHNLDSSFVHDVFSRAQEDFPSSVGLSAQCTGFYPCFPPLKVKGKAL